MTIKHDLIVTMIKYIALTKRKDKICSGLWEKKVENDHLYTSKISLKKIKNWIIILCKANPTTKNVV